MGVTSSKNPQNFILYDETVCSQLSELDDGVDIKHQATYIGAKQVIWFLLKFTMSPLCEIMALILDGNSELVVIIYRFGEKTMIYD